MFAFRYRFAVSFLFLLSMTQVGYAQHCAPITESYLSGITVKHEGASLKFRMEYAKTGGRPKAGYQAYVVVYADKNAARLPAKAPLGVIDTGIAAILHTQIIPPDRNGAYAMNFAVDDNRLAEVMRKLARIPEGQPYPYQDAVRIAVFVPFLDDAKYSVLDGLPQDKHECNYRGDRALLWEPLPYDFTLRRTPEGEYSVNINGNRPAKPPASSEGS